MNNMNGERETGYRVLAEGISVSNDTRKTGLNNNDLIIGSAGAGKTGGYVIPNLQKLSGSLVVSDTKGQLYRGFHKELENAGFKVTVIDLVDPPSVWRDKKADIKDGFSCHFTAGIFGRVTFGRLYVQPELMY